MEKFTKRELVIFNLIKQGKNKGEILAEIDTTPANFAAALTGIFKKTDPFVCYHTERTKFEELREYLRKNPTMFTPIPANDSEYATESNEAAKAVEPQKTVEPTKEENSFKKELSDFLKSFMSGLEQEKEITKAKIEVVSDIQNRFGI